MFWQQIKSFFIKIINILFQLKNFFIFLWFENFINQRSFQIIFLLFHIIQVFLNGFFFFFNLLHKFFLHFNIMNFMSIEQSTTITHFFSTIQTNYINFHIMNMTKFCQLIIWLWNLIFNIRLLLFNKFFSTSLNRFDFFTRRFINLSRLKLSKRIFLTTTTKIWKISTIIRILYLLWFLFDF